VYSLALFDVDHFKGYNDSYGHPEGDQVLRGIARTLCQVVRTSDSVYRYGGEELLVLLPETPLAGAQVLAERAREAVFDLRIRSAVSPLGWVSVSGGVASSHRPGEGAPLSWHEPLARADAALYEAKQSGRNRVVLARDGAPGRPPDA
jgi:diguanylate cyclase (GGDEF)-like protein